MTTALGRLLRPATIAIVGLSSDPAKHGSRVLAHLRRFGFRGEVWGVNRRRPKVGGVAMFSSVEELPVPPDALVVAVPRTAVPGILEQAALRGAGGAVVFTGGFSESDAEGVELQERALRAAAAGGVRIVGPNSAGVIHAAAGTVMSFLTCLDRPAEQLCSGPVGVVSQSGGIASYLHNLAAEQGRGLALTVSTGNEADVKLGEALAYLVEHPDIRAIALVLETVRDGPRFLAAARAALEAGKPVVAFKIGRTPAGAELAKTHTGALASPQRLYDGVFRSLGITVVDSPRRLLAVAYALAEAPRARGSRVGIVTHSGGHAIALADLAHELGLLLPRPGPELATRLDPLLELGSAGNPADLGAIIGGPSRFADAVSCFVEDPAYDAVVAVSSPHPPSHSVERATALVELARATPKPVVNVWSAGDVNCEGLEILRRAGVPVTEEAKDALAAVRALIDLHQLDATPAGTAAPRVDAVLARHRPGERDDPVLGERQSKELLRELGFPVPEERLATGIDDALAAADELSYPVVLKAVADGLVHKTDAGGVRLDLAGPDELRVAWTEMAESLAASGFELRAALVAPYAPGPEAIVGAVSDPVFGPLAMVGVGGIYSELLDDVVFGLAPVDAAEARRMISTLRGAPILAGARGGDPGDLDALAELVSRLSAVAAAHADTIQEADLNPVIFSAGRWRVVDAAIKLVGPA